MSDRKVIGFVRLPDGAETPIFHDEDLEQRLPNRQVVGLKSTVVAGTDLPGPDLPIFEPTEPA